MPTGVAPITPFANVEPARHLRVLVVDDDHDSADMTAQLLRIYGMETRVCYSGAQALDELAEYPADVCILDLGMPDMQGWEVAMLIRLEVENPPFLAALTAYSDPAHCELVHETGFDLHLVKPVEPAKLVYELNELAKRPR